MRLRFSKCSWIFTGLALAWTFPTPVPAQNTRLYLDSLKVLGDIRVGPHVHGIAVQADGTRLFTTSEGDKTLRIFDTSTGKLLNEIKLTGRPNQCAVTPGGKYVAVPIRDGDSVHIVDAARQSCEGLARQSSAQRL